MGGKNVKVNITTNRTPKTTISMNNKPLKREESSFFLRKYRLIQPPSIQIKGKQALKPVNKS